MVSRYGHEDAAAAAAAGCGGDSAAAAAATASSEGADMEEQELHSLSLVVLGCDFVRA